MTSATDKSTKTITIAFEDSEWDVLQWCFIQYGHKMLEDHINDFLKNRQAQMNDTHKEAVFAKYKQLSVDDKVVVDAKLEAATAIKLPVQPSIDK